MATNRDTKRTRSRARSTARPAAVAVDTANDTARAEQLAKQRAAAKHKRDAREASGKRHMPESDETVRGGFYINSSGEAVNAHGQVIDETTYKPLTGDELEDYRSDRRSELDDMANDESRVRTVDNEEEFDELQHERDTAGNADDDDEDEQGS